ncbi:T9SS type A sorting domain-containing protein [Chitinophaga oryziterrae]|uniref:chitinase n=1 Tax=Chitinophaga oryziterrae TaxID=1031224 RepID=A0A6N8J7B1_9BACT|nr:glycosyl hydrolase family 18 protein [Chitinophaga oryziterrae]MVT41155.1 T9SS type A sorting domain-containing protein [Chitinophaga oryziterrae]
MTTKKWIRAGVLSCAFLISSLLSSAQFKVVGYMPSWAGDVNAVQYSKLTHINYAFLLPNTDGSLQAIDNSSKLSNLVSAAHANGVKVMISVGGWNDGNDNGFETLAGNTTYRTNFVNNISSFVSQYNLDGADIDWEYPDAGTSANNYVSLMTQLATKLHGQGKLLTAAVVGTGGESILSSVFAQVDFLNLMAYDYNNYDHSTYAYASQSITYWKGRGLPANKTVLGVPFYGRPSWESYAALIARGASPYADTYSGVGYNGITTIKSKTDLAYDQAGGIMMWELSQDAVGTYSLLSAIHDEVIVKGGGNNPGNQSPVVSITSPAANASFSAPASITINANASDADGSITKVEFYNGSTKLGEDASSPYTYSWTNVAAGSYSLIAKATDNGGAVTTSATIAIVVTGTGGGNCNGIAAWQAASVYTNGMQVVYNSKLYTAKWWTQNEQPDTHTGDGQVWNYVADCGGGTTNPGNVSPVVSISSPAGGASFTAPASVTITAAASDADGSVAKVDFYNGSTKLGTATASPYSYTWGSVAAGTYSLTAIATDNAGATTTSGAVSITVTGNTGNTGNCAGVPAYAVYPAIYNIGDKVVYNGYLYQSLANSLYNVTPGTADWWWQPLGACSSARVASTANNLVDQSTAVQTLVAYPNPVTGSTLQLQVGAAAAEKVYIEIWSVNGTSPVLHKEYTAGAKGQQLISLDISRVPQGTFIIKTTNAAGTRKGSAKIVRM